jgi:hypothetical protein
MTTTVIPRWGPDVCDGGGPALPYCLSDGACAPIPDLPALAPERGGSILDRPSCPRRRIVGSVGSSHSHTRISSSRQLVEQRLRLLQIGGVEALGEPAVNRRQQVVPLGTAPLFAPQPGEARRRA